MKAVDLKAEILGWLRFVRKQEIVCTEVGHWNADCWGLNETRLIEVETKVTLADLKADFKKEKHRAYAVGAHAPNLFYFAVPADLEIPAAAVLEERVAEGAVSKYGLVVVTGFGFLGRNTKEIRVAKKLHENPPPDYVRRAALLRQSSEICGLHQQLGNWRRVIDSAAAELAAATRMLYDEADRLRDQRVDEEVTKDV